MVTECGVDERGQGQKQEATEEVKGRTVVIWRQWGAVSMEKKKKKGIPGHLQPCLSREEKGCQTEKTYRA